MEPQNAWFQGALRPFTKLACISRALPVTRGCHEPTTHVGRHAPIPTADPVGGHRYWVDLWRLARSPCPKHGDSPGSCLYCCFFRPETFRFGFEVQEQQHLTRRLAVLGRLCYAFAWWEHLTGLELEDIHPGRPTWTLKTTAWSEENHRTQRCQDVMQGLCELTARSVSLMSQNL